MRRKLLELQRQPLQSAGTTSSTGSDALAHSRRGKRRGKRITEADLETLPAMIHELASLLESGSTESSVYLQMSLVARLRTAGEHAQFWAIMATLFQRCAQAKVSQSDVVIQVYSCSTELADSGAPALLVHTIAQLGHCLKVAELSGAGLSMILRHFAEQIEQELDAEGARQAALAGPQSTARILQFLPLAGLALGYLAGANTLQVFSSGLGLALAMLGAAGMLAGMAWIRALVRQARLEI